jgi:hypothetical protein
MSIGRFGTEMYKFDPLLSHPNHNQWQSIDSPTLVIGRGNGSTWWIGNYDQQDYIPVDNFGGVFKDNTAHLWMDFNNINGLLSLPKNWAKAIIVDYSTWRYMKPDTKVLSCWKSILKIGGVLCFENRIASFKLDSKQGYEFDNPAHITISPTKLKSLMLDIPNLPLKAMEIINSSINHKKRRVIIPANVCLNVLDLDWNDQRSYQSNIYSAVKTALANELENLYKELFMDQVFFLKVEFLDSGYPIQTKGIKHWVRVTK